MASGFLIPDTPADTGGLIVMVRPDPERAARAIAADLHALVAVGGAETERALKGLTSPQLEHRDLDDLAAAMRRAEAIRDRTRAAESDRVSRSLNTRVAIHPDTIRRAAAELVAARHELASAQQSDARRSRRRGRLRIAGGLASAAGGAAVATVGALIPAGLAIGAAGVASSAALARRARRAGEPIHVRLANHTATALARWEQVAGVGTDPGDVEGVIRRYDPQDDVVVRLVTNSPAVRAAERLAVQRRMAWVAAWRTEVGDEGPVADPALQALLARDQTELWLGDDVPAGEPTTLVVASPYADLPAERAHHLHRQLLALPRGHRVIVVLAPDPDAPNGVRIPGIGWVPALEGDPSDRLS